MADESRDTDTVDHRLAARPALRRMGAHPRVRAAPSPRTARGMFGHGTSYQVTRLQRGRDGAPRRRDVLVVDQRRAHRPVHGRPHPRHERQGAPHVPQPRGQGVPGVAARAVGRHARAARPSTASSTTSRRSAAPTSSRRSPSVYPVQVICGIVGVPLEDAAQFARVGRADQHRPAAPRSRAWPRRRRWSTTSRPLVEARRANPNGDFLSDLVHDEVDGEQLTDEKIYGFLRLLLPAGARDDVPRHGQRALRRCSPIPTCSSASTPTATCCPESSKRRCAGRRRSRR